MNIIDRPEIHISELKQFRTCRRLWDFSSITRQNLEPVVPYAPFFFGRAVHWCLQHYYENGAHPDATLPIFLDKELREMEAHDVSMREELWEEQTTLLSRILPHYVSWAQREANGPGRWSDNNLQFIALETEFNLPLFPKARSNKKSVRAAGRFDGVVLHKPTETFWLWEVKTSGQPSKLIDTLSFDLQPSLYLWAAEQIIGKPLQGVMYQILRKKEPTYPRILNNGTLSIDARIDTTPHLYIEAAQQLHGLQGQGRPNGLQGKELSDFIMTQYGDVLRTLMEKEHTNPFFVRTPIRRTPQEINGSMEMIRAIAMEMVKPKVVVIPDGMALWGQCGRCTFRAPCAMMNAGAEPEAILEGNYQQRRLWEGISGDVYENQGE